MTANSCVATQRRRSLWANETLDASPSRQSVGATNRIGRRQTMSALRGNAAAVVLALVLVGVSCVAADERPRTPRVAAVVTEYRHNSHADVIVSRLLQGYDLNGKGTFPKLELASLYTDQVPENDTSRRLAKEHGFPIHETVADALTLGTGELAVDGVLLIAEHGKYEKSPTGQTVYPKRRLFDEIVKVFEKSGRSVPVFCDKHLADNWEDAKHLYDTSRRLDFPLMAGSSIPVLWRRPAADVKRGTELREIVTTSYHTLDAYGFHGLEMLQCLVERRAGGETGVRSVECRTGDAVWTALEDGTVDRGLFDACLARIEKPRFKDFADLKRRVKEPVLFLVTYEDGLKASMVTLNGAIVSWTAAWRDEAGNRDSTLFWTQEERPYGHFTHLLVGVEAMMHSGKPTWPVERTLLTSGILDAALVSKLKGRPVATPYLDVRYETNWTWRQPLKPPRGRPFNQQ